MEEFGSRYHFKCAPANIASSKLDLTNFLSDCFVHNKRKNSTLQCLKIAKNVSFLRTKIQIDFHLNQLIILWYDCKMRFYE